MKVLDMVDARHSVLARILLLIGVTVLVSALEEMDEALYLFLSSQMAPPPSCPELEVYHACSGNCSDCARRGICWAEGCAFKGCDCLYNFARIRPGGTCQPVHLCPVPDCGENEVFRECGAVCERCGGMRCRMLQCEHRCYCAEGHLRNVQGRCVPEEECPKMRCFRDEEMGTSGRVDEYCLRDGASSNATDTRDRCYCREGFSRNAAGHCVLEELCERVLCPGVEVYQSCPRKCNVTCRGGGDCEEDGQCFPGCFCPEGHLVDDFRRCVPEHQCPGPSTSSTEPTDSTPLATDVSSSSLPSATPDEEDIPELPEKEHAVVGTLPTTADIEDPTSAQVGTEISASPATTTTEEMSASTAAPQITDQETMRTEEDEATTLETPEERREEEVVATTKIGTPTTPSEDEENDF